MPASYHDIAADLRAAIERGDYTPGARIPTLETLAERYEVNRRTVQQAFALLKSEGVLESATSRGTRVAPLPVRLSIARYTAVIDSGRPRSDLGPWETACAEQGVKGNTELVAVDRPAVPSDLAKRLEIDPDDRAVRRIRHMWAGDRIAQIQQAWMPAVLADGTPFAKPQKIVGGVYALMRALGFGPDRVTEEVTARPPTSTERSTMRLGDSATVLEIWRTTYDRTGRIVEVLRTVADARRSTLIYDSLPVGTTEG